VFVKEWESPLLNIVREYMTGKSIKSIAYDIAEPIVSGFGYELVETVYNQSGGKWTLTLVIDKPGGISTHDCEKISHAVDPVLDQNEDIRDQYDYLQISSMGLDRPIKTTKDFRRLIGNELEIKLYSAVMNTKKFTAKLLDATNDSISVLLNGTPVEIQRSNIAKANIAISF